MPVASLATREQIYPEDLNGIDFVTFDDDLPIGREINPNICECTA